MSTLSELFWQASFQDIKQGYIYQAGSDEYICLICGEHFANGRIYPLGDQLYEAKKYVSLHIAQKHESMFHFLLSQDKKLTGLTDHQRNLLVLLYSGYSDQEAANELNAGSTSTIRNHRFSLRERQKQAKVFLAVMELLSDKISKKQSVGSAENSPAVETSDQGDAKILSAYFKQGLSGPLKLYPLKEKKRIAIIRHIASFFEAGRTYTEKEVNSLLLPFYDDYVLLRRHLIDFGFMERTRDGSAYWLKSPKNDQ